MKDEGVIKFNINWRDEDLPVQVSPDLLAWRDKMYELGLIGEYADIKIGYGNISMKLDQGMLISGTQTGNVYPIRKEHFSLVTSYNMDNNTVGCVGRIKASAESLTHAAVYEADERIRAIIHIHNKALWNRYIDVLPTSDRSVSYGTADMAHEIKRLFWEADLAARKLMVMGGHDEGLIAFGKDLNEAGTLLLDLLA